MAILVFTAIEEEGVRLTGGSIPQAYGSVSVGCGQDTAIARKRKPRDPVAMAETNGPHPGQSKPAAADRRTGQCERVAPRWAFLASRAGGSGSVSAGLPPRT